MFSQERNRGKAWSFREERGLTTTARTLQRAIAHPAARPAAGSAGAAGAFLCSNLVTRSAQEPTCAESNEKRQVAQHSEHNNQSNQMTRGCWV